MITGDFGEDFQTALLLLFLWTAAALPVMKWSARTVPLGRLARVAILTFGAMLGMIALSALITFLLHDGSRPPFWVVIGIFCVGAWLMDRRLKREGVVQPFPTIGIRAMLSAFAVIVVAVAGMLYSFKDTPSGF